MTSDTEMSANRRKIVEQYEAQKAQYTQLLAQAGHDSPGCGTTSFDDAVMSPAGVRVDCGCGARMWTSDLLRLAKEAT